MGDEAYHEAAQQQELRAVLDEVARALGIREIEAMPPRELGMACIIRVREIRTGRLRQLTGTGKVGRPMSPVTVEAMKYYCPVCKAKPGERCATVRANANSPGGEAGLPVRPHIGRLDAMREGQAREAKKTKSSGNYGGTS